MPASPSDRLLERYLDSLAHERGLAPLTVEAYGRDLRRLVGELEKGGRGLTAATAADLSRHLRRLRRQILETVGQTSAEAASKGAADLWLYLLGTEANEAVDLRELE